MASIHKILESLCKSTISLWYIYTHTHTQTGMKRNSCSFTWTRERGSQITMRSMCILFSLAFNDKNSAHIISWHCRLIIKEWIKMYSEQTHTHVPSKPFDSANSTHIQQNRFKIVIYTSITIHNVYSQRKSLSAALWKLSRQ